MGTSSSCNRYCCYCWSVCSVWCYLQTVVQKHYFRIPSDASVNWCCMESWYGVNIVLLLLLQLHQSLIASSYWMTFFPIGITYISYHVALSLLSIYNFPFLPCTAGHRSIVFFVPPPLLKPCFHDWWLVVTLRYDGHITVTLYHLYIIMINKVEFDRLLLLLGLFMIVLVGWILSMRM